MAVRAAVRTCSTATAHLHAREREVHRFLSAGSAIGSAFLAAFAPALNPVEYGRSDLKLNPKADAAVLGLTSLTPPGIMLARFSEGTHGSDPSSTTTLFLRAFKRTPWRAGVCNRPVVKAMSRPRRLPGGSGMVWARGNRPRARFRP